MHEHEGIQTSLLLSEAEDWPVTNPMRRIGWIDQRGRVWSEIPQGANRPTDGGSYTPLLIELDD